MWCTLMLSLPFVILYFSHCRRVDVILCVTLTAVVGDGTAAPIVVSGKNNRFGHSSEIPTQSNIRWPLEQWCKLCWRLKHVAVLWQCES